MAYRPLAKDSIRILHLQKAAFEADITCTLEHVSLHAAVQPSYETVSYCWGGPTDRAIVLVDGYEVQVPKSLIEALRHFRQAIAGARSLWVDSICINQSDLAERTQQVKLMGDIYSRGTRNLIWLGRDGGTVESALASIAVLTADIMTQTNDLETFPIGTNAAHYLHQGRGIESEFDMQSIITLLSRSWFFRLWVVQEATLAASNLCHCGSITFDLIALLRVAKWLWTKRTHINLYEGHNFIEIRRIFATACTLIDVVDPRVGWFNHALRAGYFSSDSDESTAPLFHILDMTTIFESTKPADHIFGVLGLWQKFAQQADMVPLLLSPNYAKPVSDVFRDATRQAMVESNSLVLLQALHHRVNDDPTFPSWVRRWDRRFDPQVDPTPFHRGFVASGRWYNDSFEPNPDVGSSVMLEGLFIDSLEASAVELISSTFTESSLDPKFIEDAELMVQSHSPANQTPESSLALSTVLCAAENAERDVATKEDLQGLEYLKTNFWSEGERPPSLMEFLSDRSNSAISSEARTAIRYAEAAWRMCFFRKLFITVGGRIGLGPQTMQKGDIAVVLYGCELPAILRANADKNSYRLVGTAWIYGVMGGEAVANHTEVHGEDADEVFTIA